MLKLGVLLCCILPVDFEKMADEYLETIMSQLPQLDVVKLGKLMDQFQIPIAEGKKGRKGAMVSAVVKHSPVRR